MAVVMDMVTEKIKALTKPAEKESTSGQTYTYVETDFIKALKNGYVVEIQEPTVITQPGVLVGLNSLLEQTGSITLPTGEVIQRHPDTVVVVTTNITYEGCRGLNQSVVDRMSLVEDIELPDPDVMPRVPWQSPAPPMNIRFPRWFRSSMTCPSICVRTASPTVPAV